MNSSFSTKTWISWLTGNSEVGSTANELTWQRWVGLFLGLGILARAIRYYLCFPLWDDESFLCVNFINRSYAELMQPLDFHQVAPILFLWVERTAVLLFGFSEYSLRLFPFICSLASLYLFHRIARRLLSGPAIAFAVAIFAVSYPGIRYAAEAKPYCTDMFVSLGLLSLVLEWQQSRNTRYLALLALLMPLALGISYPAVFAAGGLSLVIGGILIWQRGAFREWYFWIGCNASLITSFVVWFLVIGRIQSSAEGEFMGDYWKQNFPPITNPAQLPLWILKTHASDFLAYPLGGPNWASTGTFLLCLAGLWHLAQRRQFVFLGLVFAPACLHFLAAALQRYPYGGHVKFSQYLAPIICCLIAVGVSQILEWQSNWPYSPRNGFAWTVCLLLLVGSGSVVRDLACPYKTRSDFRARAFAQSFWVGTHYSEEVACFKSDLGLDFVPDQHRELSWSAQFLCNRAIEVHRSKLRTADVGRVSASRPLRCVLFRDSRYQLDQVALESWLAKMQQHYELTAHESLPFPRLGKDDRKLLAIEYIDSYRFVPKPDSLKELPPLAEGHKISPR